MKALSLAAIAASLLADQDRFYSSTRPRVNTHLPHQGKRERDEAPQNLRVGAHTHLPHQGKRERVRRVRQLARGQISNYLKAA